MLGGAVGDAMTSWGTAQLQNASAWDIAQLQSETNRLLAGWEMIYGGTWSSANQAMAIQSQQIQLNAYREAQERADRQSRRQGWMNLGAGLVSLFSPALGAAWAAYNQYSASRNSPSSPGYNPYLTNYYQTRGNTYYNTGNSYTPRTTGGGSPGTRLNNTSGGYQNVNTYQNTSYA
jgi:hypothetical protein